MRGQTKEYTLKKSGRLQTKLLVMVVSGKSTSGFHSLLSVFLFCFNWYHDHGLCLQWDKPGKILKRGRGGKERRIKKLTLRFF